MEQTQLSQHLLCILSSTCGIYCNCYVARYPERLV